MLDPRLLRTDPEAVARNLARRGFVLDVERFKALEERRKAAQVAADETRAARNAHAKSVGKAKAQGQDIAPLLAEGEALARKLEGLEAELNAVQAEFDELMLGLPNMLHESVPEGRDESANVEVRRWGSPREFDFEPLDHVGVGEKLAMIDFEAAGRISGARFVVLKGGIARLHRALIQFMLDLHTREHGYTEVYAPYLVARETLKGTGQLPKFEADLFRVVGGESEFFLIPTAEVPVTNLARDSILDSATLPRRYVAHTPCFRSEAGSYGKDTRGMIRQHQFEKVELVQMAKPEESYAALEELTGHAEQVLQWRRGLRQREDLRSRGLAAGAAEVPRDLVVQQLRGVPGPPHAGSLAQPRDRQAGAAAHVERVRRCRWTRARRGARELSAEGRQRRRARSAAAVHGRCRGHLRLIRASRVRPGVLAPRPPSRFG
jgi:seryl-tRNA synthetase